MDGKEVGDRQLDALLERLDRLTAELKGLNRRLDAGENLAPIVYELRALNESLTALAYARSARPGPQVRRRRARLAGDPVEHARAARPRTARRARPRRTRSATGS